jgi:hypothetical protein
MKINLNLVGTNATLKYVYEGVERNISKKSIVSNHAEWNNTEIRNAMASAGINYSMLIGKYFWFVLDVDTYNTNENSGVRRAILADSYVDVDVEVTREVYGQIDLTKVVPVYSYSSSQSGSFYRNLEWRYNISTTDTDLMSLDAQFAWLYQTGSNPNQKAYSNNNTLYNHPPSPLVVEFARFGFTKDTGAILEGLNKFGLQFSSGYGVNPFNSLVDYTVLLKGMVAYGDTFSTEQEAVADAVDRLKDELGDFVSATEIVNETMSVSEVPNMWGPAIAEVRTWH